MAFRQKNLAIYMDTCSITVVKNSTSSLIDEANQKVIAISLFRVVDRKSTLGRLAVYLDGVELYCKIYGKLRPDWAVRVHIDDSLYSPAVEHKQETDLFRKYLTDVFPKYDNLQIYKVKCIAHMEEGDEYHHRGLFSSMLRFFAGFDRNVKVVLFRDSDFSSNSIKHDINNVDAWLNTTSDKYMFGVNLGYTPAHADNKEAFFAGLWGVRGGLPPELYLKMDEIVRHPEYTFMREAKKKVKLAYDTFERFQERYDIYPQDQSDETSETCADSLTALERLERLAKEADTSPLINLIKMIPSLSEEDQQKYIDLIDSILICIDAPYYSPRQIIEILGVYDVIMNNVYRYGVDEIMMNHILKRELFGIEEADNANDVPISMIYFIQNNRDGFFKFRDYYDYFLPKKLKIGDPGIYSYQDESQEERLHSLYNKYKSKSKIRKVRCFFYPTIDPWLLLEPLLMASCDMNDMTKADEECSVLIKNATIRANSNSGTKFELSSLFRIYGTDLSILIAKTPTKEEKFINEFMKYLYMAGSVGGGVTPRLERVLAFFQIPTYEEYTDKLIRNLLA